MIIKRARLQASIGSPANRALLAKYIRNRPRCADVPIAVQYKTSSSLVLGFLVTIVTASADAQPILQPLQPQICGSFVSRLPLAQARRSVKRAIDEGTRELSVFVRGVARKKLDKLNHVTHDIEIAVDERLVAVGFEGKTYTSPANGAQVTIDTGDGSPVLLSQRADNDTVEQRLLTKRGEMRRVFQRRGNQVEMQVTMSSKHLSKPIKYSLFYGVP